MPVAGRHTPAHPAYPPLGYRRLATESKMGSGPVASRSKGDDGSSTLRAGGVDKASSDRRPAERGVSALAPGESRVYVSPWRGPGAGPEVRASGAAVETGIVRGATGTFEAAGAAVSPWPCRTR